SVHLAEADVDCALDAALLLLAAPDVGGVDLDAATGRHLALPRGHVATADLEQLVEGPIVQHHLEGRVVPVADGLLLAATHGRAPRSGEPTRRAPAPCRRRWPAAARRRCPHARTRGSPDRGARTTPARRAGRSPAGGRNTGSCAGAASSRPSLLPLLPPDRLRVSILPCGPAAVLRPHAAIDAHQGGAVFDGRLLALGRLRRIDLGPQ